MSKFIRELLISLSVVTIAFLLSFDSFGQTLDKDILDLAIRLNTSEKSLYKACNALTYHEGVRIGFEGVTDFDITKDRDTNIQIKSGTLKEVLDFLVKQEPDYSWEIRDGIVHIFPLRSRDDLLRSLLETKIQNFYAKKEPGKIGIRNVIYDLNQIDTLLNTKKVRLTILVITGSYGRTEAEDIDLSNADFKAVLNKIIKFDSVYSKMWSLYRVSEGEVILAF